VLLTNLQIHRERIIQMYIGMQIFTLRSKQYKQYDYMNSFKFLLTITHSSPILILLLTHQKTLLIR
jgi:hypothetical protein